MTGFFPSWYVLYTRPYYEKRIEEQLNMLSIECFLPKHMVQKRHNNRTKYVRQPMFPSYIFVRPKNQKEYYYGIDADGSLGYVKMGKELARVKDSVIEDIITVQNAGLELQVTNEHFSAGQKVKASFSMLRDIECEFVDYKNKKMGLIRLVHQNLLISLPVNNLAPAI